MFPKKSAVCVCASDVERSGMVLGTAIRLRLPDGARSARGPAVSRIFPRLLHGPRSSERKEATAAFRAWAWVPAWADVWAVVWAFAPSDLSCSRCAHLNTRASQMFQESLTDAATAARPEGCAPMGTASAGPQDQWKYLASPVSISRSSRPVSKRRRSVTGASLSTVSIAFCITVSTRRSAAALSLILNRA